jgi:hypothetical protein
LKQLCIHENGVGYHLFIVEERRQRSEGYWLCGRCHLALETENLDENETKFSKSEIEFLLKSAH